ncbi:MAG TPA: MaoC family dehydratase [Hyphomonas sp.]|nr:MaoC family dehydratase [Hyphomonas sp.]
MVGKLTQLTSGTNFFEDFEVNQTIRHARGKTVSNLENVGLTHMVMNTAQGHFNEDLMSASPFGRVISYGGINLSIVLGLASQDTIENALAEIGLDQISLKNPVVHGDTIYAYTRVLEKHDSERQDAGVIRFQHWGVNQNDKLIVQLQRIALVKRRSHWGGR